MAQTGLAKPFSGSWQSWLPELRNRHFLLGDVLTLSLTPAIALFLRVEHFAHAQRFFHGLLVYTVAALLVRVSIFYPFGLYRRLWRYATVDEMAQIALAVFVSTVAICVLFFVYTLHLGDAPAFLPRSIPLLDGLLALAAVGGTRFSIRLAR